jgi:hypothetical protein
MTRRTQRNFSRQIAKIQYLMMELDGYQITEFKTEEWAGGAVCVTRTRKPEHVQNCAYHEAFVIGVRGSVKELYSSFY